MTHTQAHPHEHICTQRKKEGNTKMGQDVNIYYRLEEYLKILFSQSMLIFSKLFMKF